MSNLPNQIEAVSFSLQYDPDIVKITDWSIASEELGNIKYFCDNGSICIDNEPSNCEDDTTEVCTEESFLLSQLTNGILSSSSYECMPCLNINDSTLIKSTNTISKSELLINTTISVSGQREETGFKATEIIVTK